jgi:hypothetical protein
MQEPERFRDATLVRIRQPHRTGGAALPVAHEKGRDLRLWWEFCRLAFPSRVRDACGPRGSSEYTHRAGVFDRWLGRGQAPYSVGSAYLLLPVSSGSASLAEP